MLPAPPRPALYLEDEAKRLPSKPSLVFGARKVFPAPPRPERMYLLALGRGLTTEY